jgi:hypothetical protein
MQDFGPIYCERILHAGLSEPINTITNLAAIIFGIITLYLVRTYMPRSYGLYLLAMLLVATGVGSFLWHGTREPLALSFDTIPGLLFLLTFLFVWVKELKNRWWGYGAVTLFVMVLWFIIYSGIGNILGFIWAGLIGVVVLFGLILTLYTHILFPTVIKLSVATLVLAAAAVTFRMIDLPLCESTPFGTHFLWHIFLSLAAFTGCVLILRIQQQKIEPIREGINSPNYF